MTLIASINGPETIWLLADRRISWAGRPPKDDAQKVMLLRTVDCAAMLGYAGLGITALGTEPSSWMHAVLHKRALPLHESLSVLAEAMEREFPRHLEQLPEPRWHIVVVPAFYGTWEGSIARLYTIDLRRCQKHKHHFVVQLHDMANTGVPPPVTMAGSGGRVLFQLMKDPKWRSPLRHMVEACRRGQIPAHAVADYLARLNHKVHESYPSSVGPRCIVVWRHRLGGRRFGGGFLYYTAGIREHDTPQLALAPPLVDAGAAGFYRVMRRHFANEPGAPDSGARVIRIPPAPTNDALESEINVEMGLPPIFPEQKLP